MSSDNLESRLEELSRSWPTESVAPAVRQKLADQELTDNEESTSNVVPQIQREARLHSARSSRRRSFYPWLGAIASSLLLVAALTWINGPRSLHAALQDSLQKAQSWYVIREVVGSDQITVGEIWYHRDHGFRMEGLGQVTLDDGTVSHTWSLDSKDPTVLLRPSMDGVEMVAAMFDVQRIPSNWRKQPSSEHDQLVETAPCTAFIVEQPTDDKREGQGTTADPNDRRPRERHVVLIDEQERPRRVISQLQIGGQWIMAARTTVDYEREVAGSIFVPDLPAGARVVDVQSALEGRFPLRDALVSKRKDGIIFAVHDALPLKDGSHYIVSSVRGSPEYLEQYPPTKRRFNLNYTALDVVSQPTSHCSLDRAQQVMMFEMEWQGVHYMWWILTHRSEAKQGTTVRVPLVGNHMHRERRDDRGVQLQSRVNLLVPIDVEQECTLEQAIANARIDMQLVSHVFGELESLPIAGSIKGSVQFTSFDDTSDEAYAKELRKARWQMQTGDFSGQDPPADYLAQSVSIDDEQAPEPELSREPLPLPSKVQGEVVDSNGQPVPDASVTVRIRRFGRRVTSEQDNAPSIWTAKTDSEGRYTISTSGTIVPISDEVRILATADSFADSVQWDFEKQITDGTLPQVKMLLGRTVRGQIVDVMGNAVSAAVVRLQSNNADFTGNWDSGPIAVDHEGRFELSIPADGKAAGVVYPEKFAPRFIDVWQASDDLGKIAVSEGVSFRGRVLDGRGKGVSKTVVGFRDVEYREMHAFRAVIGLAVKTDENGYFQSPPLDGTYKLTVAKAQPVYARQMMITGSIPPVIAPAEVNTDDIRSDKIIELREE